QDGKRAEYAQEGLSALAQRYPAGEGAPAQPAATIKVARQPVRPRHPSRQHHGLEAVHQDQDDENQADERAKDSHESLRSLQALWSQRLLRYSRNWRAQRSRFASLPPPRSGEHIS